MERISEKVAIDQAGRRDDVADSLHGLAQNIVGDAEGFKEAGAARDQFEQTVVGNGDHGVDGAADFRESAIGLLHAARSLEAERLGDHGDREGVQLLGQRGHHGRSASSGAAAQPGRDEHHVGAFENFDDPLGVLQRGLAAEAGIGTGAQAVGDFGADGQFVRHRRGIQRLHVGIQDVEFDTGEPFVHHAGYRVRASAADTDHLDLGAVQSFSSWMINFVRPL